MNRNHAKGILPKVLNFEIAKIVETADGLSTKNAHFSISAYVGPRQPHIYRYRRGADFFRFSLLRCLAIPEIDGRDADRLTSFAYLTPTAGPESEAPPDT